MRKKVPQPPTLYDNKPQYTSEPYLTDEADTPVHQPVRRGSQRRSAQNNQSTYAPGECALFAAKARRRGPKVLDLVLKEKKPPVREKENEKEADCSIFLKDTSFWDSSLTCLAVERLRSSLMTCFSYQHVESQMQARRF